MRNFSENCKYPATTTMEQFFRRVADTLCVPDMDTSSCLDPGENGAGFEGRGNARPYPLERGKIGSWSPVKRGTTWRKKKKSPFGRDEGGSAANRVSRRLIMLVFFMSVIAGVLIVIIVVFSFRRINHMELNHLHWSSVYTFADHHVPNTLIVQNNLPEAWQ
jgi:hypothetical protein